MPSEPVSVTICIATFRRPQSLLRLLLSVETITVPAATEVLIVIVDNDSGCSAREIVADFSKRSRFPVAYAVEAKQNISRARNRCVELATGDYIAFVDDDEEVSFGWLAALLDAAARFDADAVFGPVLYTLPSGAQDWVREGNFYKVRRMPTGTLVTAGGTGNALVRSSILKKLPGPFDPAFGLTGGEDYDLFTRLRENGAVFCWCDEAVILEHVGEERLSIRYLLGRALRGGQQFAVLRLARMDRVERASWILYRLLLTVIASAGTICSLPLGRKRWVRWMQKIWSNMGQLSALTRFRYEQYGERTNPPR